MTCWYVLRTRPNAEFKVNSRLMESGVESYLPVYSSLRQWSDRKKKIQRPLVSSVVFVHCAKEELFGLTRLEGVSGILYFLGVPAMVRMSEIETLKCMEREWDKDSIEYIHETFGPGDIVRVMRGPFKGLYGNSVDMNGKHRLFITIDSIGTKFTVSVPKSFVRKVTNNHPA